MTSCCLVIVSVLWVFLMVPWVGLQCVIVLFPDHTHFFLTDSQSSESNLKFVRNVVSFEISSQQTNLARILSSS